MQYAQCTKTSSPLRTQLELRHDPPTPNPPHLPRSPNIRNRIPLHHHQIRPIPRPNPPPPLEPKMPRPHNRRRPQDLHRRQPRLDQMFHLLMKAQTIRRIRHPRRDIRIRAHDHRHPGFEHSRDAVAGGRIGAARHDAGDLLHDDEGGDDDAFGVHEAVDGLRVERFVERGVRDDVDAGELGKRVVVEGGGVRDDFFAIRVGRFDESLDGGFVGPEVVDD